MPPAGAEFHTPPGACEASFTVKLALSEGGGREQRESWLVRRITIVLDDHEFKELVKEKGNLTWKEFVFKLLEFKRKVEEEEETLHREALKEPYIMQAQALRAIGKLMKFGTEDLTLQKEYEQAALLPLYVSGVELSEEEKRELMLILANVLEELVKELYPERLDEVKWFIQALRMLARDKERFYESSLRDLCEEVCNKLPAHSS